MTKWSTDERFKWKSWCDLCDEFRIDDQPSGEAAHAAVVEHIKASHPGRSRRRYDGYTVSSYPGVDL